LDIRSPNPCDSKQSRVLELAGVLGLLVPTGSETLIAMNRPSKTKASALSHKALVAQITKENRVYMAKLDAEKPILKPASSKREFADEIKTQKLKDAATVRQILEAQAHRQPSIRPPHTAPHGSAWIQKWEQQERDKIQPYQSAHTQLIAAPKNKSFQLPEGFGKTALVSILALVVAVGLSYMAASALVDVANHPSKPATLNLNYDPIDAYAAAKQFMKQQYPGAQSFSDYDHSKVIDEGGGDCFVSVTVNGVNAFNAPIRDAMGVNIRFQDGNFFLRGIDSLNEINSRRD
jgi:hypothetical protein